MENVALNYKVEKKVTGGGNSYNIVYTGNIDGQTLTIEYSVTFETDKKGKATETKNGQSGSVNVIKNSYLIN
ncbi:hypothetical protein R4Q14_00120 [Brachyspira intermedia]|uniref:hypothetical protein n=1 Tax=Brachyspira intermedia TaxID=84377 RepID=UPI0030064CB8